MAPNQAHRQLVAVKTFFDAVGTAAGGKPVDAEVAAAVMKDNSIIVPESVQAMVAKFDPKWHGALLDSVRVGSEAYKREHGFAPDAGLVQFAIERLVRSATPLKELNVFDYATNTHQDNLSLQPATAIVSIMAMFAEAIPWAAYLSADVKSNEARIAIFDNKARSDFGDYADRAVLNGVAGGGVYLDSERVCLMTANGGAGPFTFVVTQLHSYAAGGIAASGSNVAMKLLRGRSVVVINGLPVAREVATTIDGTGNNAVAGTVTIAATTYTIGGTVNSDTGAISITTSAALPAGTVVEVFTYIDFERAPEFAPKVGTEATVYQLFARASRGIAEQTMDSMTQMQNELGLDPRGQALMAIRAQYAQERWYRAQAKMMRVAAQLTGTWDYDRVTQIAQKDRPQLWFNLMPVLASLSQTMAERTVNHGITTLLMTGTLAAECRALPSMIFESSGIVDRPGVYRLGRLFGLFDVYYTPKGLTDTSTTSQILAVGRATETARNPLVLGDAVPPVFLPLAMNSDMVTKDGFYCRSFTELNPHLPSAQGAALISVINR